MSRFGRFRREAIVVTTLLPELQHLDHARETAAAYYAPLLKSQSEIVRVGAWCALLDREAVTPEQHSEILGLCSYGAVQSRAFRYFEGNWDHDEAASAADAVSSRETEADDLARKAELACDDQMAAEAPAPGAEIAA